MRTARTFARGFAIGVAGAGALTVCGAIVGGVVVFVVAALT